MFCYWFWMLLILLFPSNLVHFFLYFLYIRIFRQYNRLRLETSNLIYDPALINKELSVCITHLFSKTMLIILLGRRDAFRVYAETHRSRLIGRPLNIYNNWFPDRQTAVARWLYDVYNCPSTSGRSKDNYWIWADVTVAHIMAGRARSTSLSSTLSLLVKKVERRTEALYNSF